MIPLVEYSAWKASRSAAGAGADPLEAATRAIIDEVASHGDRALRALTERFDGVRLGAIRAPEENLERAFKASDPEWRRIVASAAENIRRFHEHQRRESWFVDDGDDVRLGQRVLPLETVGLYVPGGRAAYSSSVLMTAIPAQVAGVKDIHLASPPQKSGLPHEEILATAHLLGLRNVYCVGGAQAIAALAYGTDSVPKVDKIVGPGSAYVTAAKRLVFGLVDIDALAGPSEIVILADETACPLWVAHDLLAQAEHDTRASAILVTWRRQTAEAVQDHIVRIAPTLERRAILERSLRDHGACIVTKDEDDAIAVVNSLAPEHLELMVRDPWDTMRAIKHAGAIFLGPWSPEPVGDYFAGPNHVLPTGGAARYASALGVDDFTRTQSVIAYSRARLEKTGPAIAAFARSEALTAHARAVEVRLDVEQL